LNKPLDDVPEAAEWHHASVDPLAGETSVGKEEQAPVSVEENKALVRRFFEAQAKGDLDAVREMMAPDFVDHSLLPGQTPGREGYLQSVAEDSVAFSDVHNIFEEQLIDGDKVISRISTRVLHDRREYFGLMPAGKEYEVTSITIHRIVGGKIAEEWSQGSDLAELTQERLEQEIRERERVEQELRVARSIQQASLPKEVPTLGGWQISPFYQPAREVGGDFYDFLELPDGHLGLVVGDATGKGVPAALVMASARSMLRAVAKASESPGEVLGSINDPLVTDIPPNMFVTCFYAILDPESGRLTYANAGHDLPYLHRRNAEAEELRARGMPLGLMPGMSYEQKETMLHTGEAALFYSDGLVEAHNPKGEMFGFPRLRALVAEHDEQKSLEEFLHEELYSFVGESWEQEDDITLLTLERSATRS
jgi:serine phosphatase RsbU (regulator of sigma subunit)/predicted ester cyclase